MQNNQPPLRSGDSVVLALGGGAARGFAHIGVIRALEENGLRIAAVAGSSIGSVVGGVYAAGRLDDYEQAVRALSRRDLLSMMDVSLPKGGLFSGRKLARFVQQFIGEVCIEDLSLPYRAVAVDLATGREVWLDSGSLLTAMRASSAIPGVFRPILVGQQWLADGGLASPLPLGAAEDLASLPVIAVDLNAIGPGQDAASQSAQDEGGKALRSPGLVQALGAGLAIVCHHLTSAQVAQNPPALLLQPNLADRGLFDVSAVGELIGLGHACASETLLAAGLMGKS